MLVVPFVLAIAAVALFVYAFVDQRRSWLALGLAVLTLAWMLQLVLASGTRITVGG